MIEYSNVRDVHLEISTLCNAACPQCPRNANGYPHNDGYPELNLTLENAKKIFSYDFLQQLISININGNFGDIVMNPEGADIIEYFFSENKKLKVSVSTNAGARNRDFWQRLARAGAQVTFCIDGLEDTHHLYRQNTVWSTVIKNAQVFIDAGGKAIWKMIKFKHNQHQIVECQRLSRQLGFWGFQIADQGRDTGPVYDKNGNLTHILGDYQGETEFRVVFYEWRSAPQDIKNYKIGKTVTKLECETINRKSIYIAANGDVFPCCYLGLYPRTFGHGTYSEAANKQIAPLMRENNALEFPLDHCLKWFKSVEESWKKQEYTDGRLFVCDKVCGS